MEISKWERQIYILPKITFLYKINVNKVLI